MSKEQAGALHSHFTATVMHAVDVPSSAQGGPTGRSEHAVRPTSMNGL
jgi:hypothetical protein